MIKAGKAMVALKTSMEDDLLKHIKDVKSPKEIWDAYAALFTRRNDACLQLLENELLTTSQKEMTISEYFTKIKSLYHEISKFYPESKISKTRMKRIIIHGLRQEFNPTIIAIRGADKEEILQTCGNLFVHFQMKELRELRHFLKLQMERTDDGLFLCQRKYAKDILEKFGMMECKPISTPMETNARLFAKEGKDLENTIMY
ncbi:hypothetical protein GH714_030531 [Hevea brasiliensis]|uniref:Uncharacterized protein n=1 Tax=Hevea brasiliensis TaxID=3981 RepID=A0A6A6N7D3_HEVBR|nr:hypothetical protein GH714_030531 [Hevea brasiliensis]